MSSALAVHLACLALVGADLVARSWRMQLLLGSVGHPLGFARSFAINCFGDAAATLTPLRVAGQPARVLAIVHDGVPVDATLVALGVEAAITYTTVAACALLLVAAAMPGGLASLGGAALAAGDRAWPWLAALAILAASLWAAIRWRRGRTGADRTAPPGPVARMEARLAGMWALVRAVPLGVRLLAVPLSIVNVMGRVAVLPVLAQLLPSPPAPGSLWLGSFALLYGQLIVPTPAGAGVVDAGFLAGAAAVDDGHGGGALFWWRLYTSGIGLALGLLLGAPRYGIRPVFRLMRDSFRRGSSSTTSGERP